MVPAGVEQLFGNRDPNKTADERKNEGKPSAIKDPNSPKGLSQLVGKSWDAVIRTSGFFPRMVRASAELLAPVVRQYVFISTISVYKDARVPNFDESAPLATLADPATEVMGQGYANYGGGKGRYTMSEERPRTGMGRGGFEGRLPTNELPLRLPSARRQLADERQGNFGLFAGVVRHSEVAAQFLVHLHANRSGFGGKPVRLARVAGSGRLSSNVRCQHA